MKIALGVPAYKQSVHVGVAYAWAQDMATAMEMGWKPVLLWNDVNSIEVARNLLVQQAMQAEARLLLMMDSDSAPILPEGGLRSMWGAMTSTGAAVAGAAVAVRNGRGMNCEPARPGEVYEGIVGTAYMLVDLWKLRDLPRPWFTVQLAEDGMSKAVGSDIGFCRAVQAAGHAVVVNFALPMAHAEIVATATRP